MLLIYSCATVLEGIGCVLDSPFKMGEVFKVRYLVSIILWEFCEYDYEYLTALF